MSYNKYTKFTNYYGKTIQTSSIGCAVLGTLWGILECDNTNYKSNSIQKTGYVLSYGLLGGIIGGTIVLTAPFSIPYITYRYIKELQ